MTIKKIVQLLKPFAAVYQLSLVATLLLACGESANASSEQQQPVLAPFPEPPPPVALTEDEKNAVNRGEAVYKRVSNNQGEGRASAVFRVKANKETIWSTIKQFDKYPEWVPNVKAANVYTKAGSNNIFVEFKLSAMFMTYTYYIKHNYPAPNDSRTWGTWTLDYDKKSEINDSVGFWNVEPVPGDAKLCTVTYSVAIDAGGLANILRPILEDSGVQDATTWLKKQAERRSRG